MRTQIFEWVIPHAQYSFTLWFLQVCKISSANPTPTTVSYQKGSWGWHYLCSNMLHPGWFDIVRDGFPCSSLFLKHLTCKGLLSTLRVSPKNQIIEYSNSKRHIMVNLPLPLLKKPILGWNLRLFSFIQNGHECSEPTTQGEIPVPNTKI